jgi:Holliday junction resolvasome RuvABC endonuclease subunit
MRDMRVVTGTILALDLATATGFAVGEPSDPVPLFGTHTLPSTGEDVGAFGVAYEDWLLGMVDQHDPELVIFEMPILPKQTSLQTVRKLTGLAFATETVCTRRRLRCREGRASTVKKQFTGYGHAEKADTQAICRRYGWRVQTGDEGDACALWAYAIICFAPDHASRFQLGPLGAEERF